MVKRSSGGGFVGNANVRDRVVNEIMNGIIAAQSPTPAAGEAIMKLYSMLEVLAANLRNERWTARLRGITEDCPINIDNLAQYYALSWKRNPRRCVRFTDIGRMPYSKVQCMTKGLVVKPLVALAVEVVGVLAQDKGTIMRSFLERYQQPGFVEADVGFNKER